MNYVKIDLAMSITVFKFVDYKISENHDYNEKYRVVLFQSMSDKRQSKFCNSVAYSGCKNGVQRGCEHVKRVGVRKKLQKFAPL